MSLPPVTLRRHTRPAVPMKPLSHELKRLIFARTGGGQSTFHRLVMFGMGGALSYVLNTAVFLLLHRSAGLSEEIAYAVSLTLMTVITYSWSYWINFRTSRSFRSCLPRYLATMAIGYTLNYTLVQVGFNLWPGRQKLIILIVMALVAVLKFVIYHKWVFPRDASESVVQS